MAQQPPPPAAPVPPAPPAPAAPAPAVSPAPAQGAPPAALPAPGNINPQPQGGGAPALPAGASGTQAPPPALDPNAPPPGNTVNPIPNVLTPVNTGPLPSLVSPTGDKSKGGKPEKEKQPTYKEIEMNSALRNKSPFMIPTELYLKIKRRQSERIVENVIDDNVSPKIRWPLRSYTLIGVLGGVKVPKALIQDRDGKIHTYRNKELIANSGGYITEIGNGEVIVVERGAEIKLSLKKDSK